MSKVILVANRCEFVPYEKDAVYIGIDRGSFFCMNKKLPLLCAIGDFDSLTKEEFNALKSYTKIIELPCEKNETDGEYAIRYAHKQGYDQIDVYGVSGGRLDHFMIIMNLLRYGNISFRIIDKQNIIYTLEKGKYEIIKKKKYLSFFACEEIEITLTDVRYPLENVTISPSDIYLVSNEIIKDKCFLEISGKIIVIESED